MKINIINPNKALRKAYLKQNVSRLQIETFKLNFKMLFEKAQNAHQKAEHEEHFKNIVSDFLKNTYYKDLYDINISKRKDLVIHNGKSSSDTIGVIIEAKKPDNSAEMISTKNLNVKAFWELILYYFNEREENKNIEVKHLIANNLYEWFIFDENDFDKLFYRNPKFLKLYKTKFEQSKDNPFFYAEVQKLIAEITDEISCIYLDFKDFEKIAFNNDNADDEQLIDLYKILSPEHLLKKPFANDSNSLNKNFYNELLHIIGLEEKPEGGKKLIYRKSEQKREEGSLIENTINFIDRKNDFSGSKIPETELYSIALELCITWLNRILFLKLLEGQLVKYHNGNQDYLFLNSKTIKDFDELEELFFDVLAKKIENRSNSSVQKFGNIPYLNSSLFEPTEFEQNYVFISNLKDRFELSLFNNSVLLNKDEFKNTKTLNTLQYLFEFLSAYNFSSETSAKIQEDNKTIINASVLGLIFEKINGYKDGSFFTPGFITMYMSRETIRRAVAQKFKELENKEIETFDDVKNYCSRFFKKDDIQRFNEHINSLKICDPAVGSGHFLVSALNEIIAIKSELNILTDNDGTPLEYEISVDNDELIIINKRTNKPFEYVLGNDNKPSKQLQTVQYALFHEKQEIIENCLFGVDINPKSVLICRLRLWIELLKNAYYKMPEMQLETLPNIDINIKCGNSLISRFPININLKQIAKSSKWTIFSYQNAVHAYKNSTDKKTKLEIEKLIKDIKSSYITTIQRNNPNLQKYYSLKREYDYKFPENGLFMHEPDADYDGNKQKREAEKQRLASEIKKVFEEIENEKKFFENNNAFEWRFEFPEVLNEDGDFLGFDVVIGNPPYFIMTKQNTDNNLLNALINNYLSIKKSTSKNIFTLFIEKGVVLLKQNGNQSFIVPEGLFYTRSYTDCVSYMKSNGMVENITTIEGMVFDKANTGNVIFVLNKSKKIIETKYFHFNLIKELKIREQINTTIIEKLNNSKNILKLKNVCEIFKGMVVKDRKDFIFNKKSKKNLDKFLLGSNISKWMINSFNFSNFNDLTIIGGTKLKSKHDVFPKILIRRTGDYLCCAYLEKKALTESTLYSCWSKNIKIENKFILSLFHSKLYDYIVKNYMITNKEAFPQILMSDLENLPIKIISQKAQAPFIEKVDKILTLKKENPQAETSQLEAEIDQMVYRLYELTDEEIKIVEGK